MARINENYLKLQGAYLFPEIDRRVRLFTDRDPAAADRIIRCGIGDVTEPLPPAVLAAMHTAVDEMGQRETFRGYAPPLGYGFLREAIAAGDFSYLGKEHGPGISAEEIFVSDGSKVDCGAILDILGGDNRTGITDPVYPVYVDTNVMAGRTGAARDDGGYEGLVYLPCTAANGFVPEIPDEKLDLVYLCYPNNPTGGMITHAQLAAWVEYALANDTIILYDVAYHAFVKDAGAPRSIYEIDGARRCAMEFHSFSKTAATRSARRTSPAAVPTAAAFRCTISGRGVGARSPTASHTSCNAGRRRSTLPRDVTRSPRSSVTTWKTRGCSAKAVSRSA